MTNEPEPNTRAGEAQAHQLATALMGVERFTADGNFHPDYLAMLTRPLPQPSDTWRDSQFLVATVSQDGREVGIDHPTDANWDDVLRAHISLRDRINERLAENGNCPFKPQPSELEAEVKRLTALADDHFRNARRLSEVVVARDAQIAKLQARLEVVPGWSEDADGIACRNDTIKLQDECIAKLQADGDKLAGAATALRDDMLMRAEMHKHRNNGVLVVEAGNGVWHRINEALTEWKDRA